MQQHIHQHRKVKNTTLEDAYADLDKDQYERVILAVSLKAAIDSKSLYMNESVLMNINAHAEDAVILQYSVEGAEAENIVNSYVNYINSGSIVSDINKEGVHVAEGYLFRIDRSSSKSDRGCNEKLYSESNEF